VIADLRCEFLREPLGIDDEKPALSWTIKDSKKGVFQVAYRVLVATTPSLLNQNVADIWDSKRIDSDKSHLVIYEGKPLESRQRYYWKVEVQTKNAENKNIETTWSETSWWEMGLIKQSDWEGSWISSSVCKPVNTHGTHLWSRMMLIPQYKNEAQIRNAPKTHEIAEQKSKSYANAVLPVPVFRKEFEVNSKVKKARLYVTALGFQKTYINGKPVNNRVHEPSVTYYAKRGGYVSVDISAFLVAGKNTISTMVGSGWWNEPLVWGNPKKVMGEPCMRVQVELEFQNGGKTRFSSDKSWETAIGPIEKSHYWAGELFDARKSEGWLTGENEKLKWIKATEIASPVPQLVAQKCEPERVVRKVKPISVQQPKEGIWVFDMGELLMGTIQLNIKANRGDSIIIRTAEWKWNKEKQGEKFNASKLHYDNFENNKLTDGMIACRPRGGTFFSWSYRIEELPKLRKVHLGVPTHVYIANGDSTPETWTPTFTTQPYRYIEVQGLKEKPSLNLLTGLVITNDEEVIGDFTSGNERFNRIWEASMNSTRYTTHGMTWDNAVERAQSQVYNAWSAPFASYGLWYPNLWRKIMEDQRLGNSLAPKNMRFGNVIYGNRWGFPAPFYAVTQSVTVELPMQYYYRYGDVRELEKHYQHMKTWVEAFFPDKSGNIIDRATMGAWSDHFYKEMSDDCDWTPEWDRKAMMSMMMYEYAIQTAEVGEIIGKTVEVQELKALAANIKKVINDTWYNKENKTYGAAKSKINGKIDDSTGWHGLMAMAVAKKIAPHEDVPEIIENCIKDMNIHYKGHPAAGHITHQLLYDVFADNNMTETCYAMMNATGFPSFDWMLQSGNKTIPEGPTMPERLPSKSSAYQNECQEPARWFTQSVCGVVPDRKNAGFKHYYLKPQFPSALPSAQLLSKTPYGKLESSWTKDDKTINWTVEIPANSSATITLAAETKAIMIERLELAEIPGIKNIKTDSGNTQFQLGSGKYNMTFPAPENPENKLK
jgi:alpha-L-rhamnosidase